MAEFNDKLVALGGIHGKKVAKTAAYQATKDDYLIVYDTTSGALNLDLPLLADAYDAQTGTGQILHVVLETDGGDLTVREHATDGAATMATLNDAGDGVTLQATSATVWTVIRSSGTVTADLTAGIISADAAGRGLFAAGVFDAATVLSAFAADSFDETNVNDAIANSAIDDPILKSLGTTRCMGGRDLGRACIGYVYCTGAAADTELVTINGRTYEFDTDSTSTGDVAVDISGDATADAAMTALAAAINGDGSAVVEAKVMVGNADTGAGVYLVANTAQATNYTLTTDITNGGTASAATLAGAAAVAQRDFWFDEYTVTAADVTLLALAAANEIPIAAVTSTTQPKLCGLTVRTSAGAFKAYEVATTTAIWNQVNSNFWVLVVNDGAALLASGDVIGWSAGV